MKHSLRDVSYAAPEDGPTFEQVADTARRLHLTLDEFVSRAIILYVEEAAGFMDDPAAMAQFDLDRFAKETSDRGISHDGTSSA